MTKKAHELLRSWFNKADALEKLHREASYYYSKKDSYITIPIIIISSLAGSISFISISSTENNYVLPLLSGSLNICATIMSSTKEYFGWNKKYYDHNNAASAYLKLKNLIEIQLALHKLGLNIPYEKMIPEIGSLVNKIDNDAEPLPGYLSDKYIIASTDNIDVIVDTNTEEKDISSILEKKILNQLDNIEDEFNNDSS
jgi:hypothetical protein